MRLLLCSLVVVAAAACTDSSSGEPIDGDVTIHIGAKTVMPDVGAAIVDFNDSSKLLVMIGTDGFSCKTTEQSLIRGTALLIEIAPTPGMQDAFTSVAFSNASGGHLNGSTGHITIDSIDTRVRGSVMFETTDDEEGTISASGTFDVIRCP